VALRLRHDHSGEPHPARGQTVADRVEGLRAVESAMESRRTRRVDLNGLLTSRRRERGAPPLPPNDRGSVHRILGHRSRCAWRRHGTAGELAGAARGVRRTQHGARRRKRAAVQPMRGDTSARRRAAHLRRPDASRVARAARRVQAWSCCTGQQDWRRWDRSDQERCAVDPPTRREVAVALRGLVAQLARTNSAASAWVENSSRLCGAQLAK
jgi:hypothetical protein